METGNKSALIEEKRLIRIAGRSDMYDYLSKGDYEDSEDWKSQDKSKCVVDGVPIPLKWPVYEISLSSVKSGEFYSSYAEIIPRWKVDFSGLSGEIFKNLPEGWIWEPAENIGTGHFILSRDKRKNAAPDISILKSFNCYEDRNIPDPYEIHLGNAGAIPRRFSSFEDFDVDMNNLEDVTSVFLFSCYSIFNKKPANKIKTFYLSCL